MGKVREETPARSSKERKPTVSEGAKPSVSAKPAYARAVTGFFSNLVRTERYKPTQGKRARLWTAIGLGAVFLSGLYTFYNLYLADQGPLYRYNTALALAAVAAWVIWRIVEYPPFAEFLIATEAEMNKVSWTSWDDLKRATAVVLATVFLISMFLFGVDVLWSELLKLIGVLSYDGGGAFGSQAG